VDLLALRFAFIFPLWSEGLYEQKVPADDFRQGRRAYNAFSPCRSLVTVWVSSRRVFVHLPGTFAVNTAWQIGFYYRLLLPPFFQS
jgi:hypothetical protein